MGCGSFTAAASHRLTPSVGNLEDAQAMPMMPPSSQNPVRRASASGRRSVLGIFAVGAGAALASHSRAASAPTLTIGYVHWQHNVDTISYMLFQPAPDNGRAGAEVAIVDNNTTSRFMNQNFARETIEVRMDDNPVAALETLMAKGIRFVITDRPAADVLQLADAAARHGVTIFNAGAHDDVGFWPRSGFAVAAAGLSAPAHRA